MWQAVNGSSKELFKDTVEDQTRYLIPDLERLTTYIVWVRANNRIGKGRDSEEFNITTDAVGELCTTL